MAKYRKKGLLILMLALLIFDQPGSSQNLTCSDIRNGVFILISKRDGTKFTYIRTGTVQKEFNGTTRETFIWEVEWINDCSYFLKYSSGAEDQPKQVIEILKKHRFVFQIVNVSEDYYVFESYPDKASNPVILKDTLWIKQRKDVKNKLISNPRIDSLVALKKAIFDSSLSKTATLYIFRPGKFVEGGLNCTIFYKDTPICMMTNNSTNIVRLLKEGPAEFVARIGKKEMGVLIDIKYGKKYFLRCELIWGIPVKPIFTLSNQDEARPYFGNIK